MCMSSLLIFLGLEVARKPQFVQALRLTSGKDPTYLNRR